MTTIAIIGDGPGGLSAALFLAKAGHTARVYGTDGTVMNYAHLHNYLGVPDIGGTEFQQKAREQVTALGAEIIAEEVTAVAPAGEGFEITTESGTSTADFVVLSEGKSAPLAESLGLSSDGDGDDTRFVVDRDGRSSVAGVYVVGRSVRPTRSQAIISAGDGAAAALDILSTIEGKNIQDWDSPPKDD